MIKLNRRKENLKISHNQIPAKGIIGVCGGANISPPVYRIAEELGKEIAKAGYIIICGGKSGTMEAVCKGAKNQNGITIGILPESTSINANKYVDIKIPTGLGEARNVVLINSADGIITVAGESGTLNEIALAWRSNKPIVAITSTGGWSQKIKKNSQIDSTRTDQIIQAENPAEAVSRLIQQINKKG